MTDRRKVSDAEIEALRGVVVRVDVDTLLMGVTPYEKPYWGKISHYDADSLTLNPYFEAADYMSVGVSHIEGLEDLTEKFAEVMPKQMERQGDNLKNIYDWVKSMQAGVSTKEITFKREDIALIYDFENA